MPIQIRRAAVLFMRTLESFVSEKIEYLYTHPEFFKKCYGKKMGGTQTVILEEIGDFYFDDRKYYSGRGNKYNNDRIHDNIGNVYVSKEEIDKLAMELAKSAWDMYKGVMEREKKFREDYNRAVELVGKDRLEAGLNLIRQIKYKAYYFIDNVELYHGYMSDHVMISIIDESRRKEFDWEKWASAPYAFMMGMTPSDKNLFVC